LISWLPVLCVRSLARSPQDDRQGAGSRSAYISKGNATTLAVISRWQYEGTLVGDGDTIDVGADVTVEQLRAQLCKVKAGG